MCCHDEMVIDTHYNARNIRTAANCLLSVRSIHGNQSAIGAVIELGSQPEGEPSSFAQLLLVDDHPIAPAISPTIATIIMNKGKAAEKGDRTDCERIISQSGDEAVHLGYRLLVSDVQVRDPWHTHW